MILTIRDVEETVCARFHLTEAELRGRSRLRIISRPRMIAMYLARELTRNSLPRIGRHFHRDHTTVLNACRRVRELADANAAFRAHLESCHELLSHHVPWKQKAREVGL
jgi:chromosomal replication initiator protein